MERLKQLMFDETTATTVLLPKVEEDWCSLHNLVQSSLKHVSEICMLYIAIMIPITIL